MQRIEHARAPRHLVMVACLCGLLAGCHSGPGRTLHDLPDSTTPEPTTPRTIFGYVMSDSTHAPLEGAQVFAPGPMEGSLVDSAGRYAFTVPEPGHYRIVAQIIGFESDTFAVQVDSAPVRIDFSLPMVPVVLQEGWRPR